MNTKRLSTEARRILKVLATDGPATRVALDATPASMAALVARDLITSEDAAGLIWKITEAAQDKVCPGTRMKTVRNLMSGKEMTIPVNTPRACDPSSEAYWSA